MNGGFHDAITGLDERIRLVEAEISQLESERRRLVEAGLDTAAVDAMLVQKRMSLENLRTAVGQARRMTVARRGSGS